MTREEEKREFEIVIDVPPGYREEGRLDQFLARSIMNATRSKVQRGIREGRVRVNDRVITRSSHIVQAGDHIVCRILRAPPIEAVPEDIPLDVVFEDDWLIVVNKPAGMVVHPAYGNRTGTLVNALLHYVGASAITLADVENGDDDAGLSTINAAPPSPDNPAIRPGIVHRLDKDTSGLLVVAKDDVTHAALAGQFAARTTRRDYLGIVLGIPDPARGSIESNLGRDKRDRKRMAVVEPPQGKFARTHYETVAVSENLALLRFQLDTGRTHQIRAHAAHIGHPILADETYGGADLRRFAHSRNKLKFLRNLVDLIGRQALHARSLGFQHPKTGSAMTFETTLPVDMTTVLERAQIDPKSY